jgi:hypothetical protein
MTAILITRTLKDHGDILYIAADQRVTAGDTIISNNYNKIITQEASEVHPHRRHYVMCGDLFPVEYLIHRLEKLTSFDDLYSYMFENEIFTKLPASVTFYVIDELPGKPQILQIFKHKKTSGVINMPLDELLSNPIFDGSGGEVVVAAYKALELTRELYGIEGAKRDKTTTKGLITLSFAVGADIINSMNEQVTIVEIPIKKFRKKKEKHND